MLRCSTTATLPNTQTVRPPHIPSIPNPQLSPSISSARKRETPGILSRMFPSFVGNTSYRVRSHVAPPFAMLCFVCYCLLCYLFVSPSLLIFGRLRYCDRPWDRWCFGVRLRLRFRRFLSSTELPGKPPPWSPDIAYSPPSYSYTSLLLLLIR